MEFQTFSTYQHYHVSTLDDLPSFEDAFEITSLRKYYHSTEIPSFCSLAKEGLIMDEGSPAMTDDRETQSSPQVNYIDSAINFNHKYSSDHFESLNSSRRISFEELFTYNNSKSLDDVPSQNFSGKPIENKKVIEMKGHVNMTMSFGNLSVKGGNQNQLAVSRFSSQSTVASEHEESSFEKLIRLKKIFKIQRDPKSKTSPKLKAASPQIKAVSPQAQPQPHRFKQLPFTTYKMPPRTDMMNQQVAQNKVAPAMQNTNTSVFNFLQVMQEKGYTPQQIMGEIQKFAQANPSAQYSPPKKI